MNSDSSERYHGIFEVIKNEMFGHIGVPQYVEYARDIYGSGSHLLDIINDILDLSKVGAGKFSLSEENVAIEEVVFAVSNIIKARRTRKICISRRVCRVSCRACSPTNGRSNRCCSTFCPMP